MPPCSPRALLTALLSVVLLGAGPAEAAWPPEGIPLCTACRASFPLICSDGADGAFTIWVESRNGNHDVYAQRVTGAGAIAPGWPADGLPVCVEPSAQQLNTFLPPAPDGYGGVLVTWQDRRNLVPGGTSLDIYAQRVGADGVIASGWPVNGAPVAVVPGVQDHPGVIADGGGGAFIAWEDGRDGNLDIYLQRLGPTGEPAPGWPVNGLVVCNAPGFQCCPFGLVSDGSGGVFVAWHDERDGAIAVYAQRVLADGSLAPGWPVNGTRLVLGRAIRELMSDGAGGVYLSSATFRGFGDGEYYLQRITGAGETAPGWPAAGTPVCTAAGERHTLRMVADQAGGVLLTWHDYRESSQDEVYVQRVRPDGSLSPGWPPDGLRITDNQTFDSAPDLAPDGLGGAYLGWSRYDGAGDRIMVSRATGAGSIAPGWAAGGEPIPPDVPAAAPRMTADGSGGAIVAWGRTGFTVWALKLSPDGPVPVQLSLVSAEAEPGWVRLVWALAGDAGFTTTLERRGETTDWEALGALAADGTGRLTYEDRAVIPGARYGYRLAYPDGAGIAHTAETWVTVPELRFALRGFTPNPGAGDPVVSFSLASSEPARLELFDLSGRLVHTRALGRLGPGAHSIRLEGRALPAGVYTVRLRQGPRVATARAVVVR